jgi:HPt (histidine-containing phosphotransfer) domain-containing protein
MPTDPSPAPRVLDPEVLDNLRSLQDPGDGDFVTEIVLLFLSDTAMRLQTVRDSAARGDLLALAEVAHLLKGSAGLIGAEGMVEASLRLEQASRLGVREPAAAPDAAAVADMTGQLARAFDELRAAFVQLGIVASDPPTTQGPPGSRDSQVP